MVKYLMAVLLINFSVLSFAEKKSDKTNKMDKTNLVYKIDLSQSTVKWKGFKKVGDPHHGEIKLKEGEISLNKKNQLTSGQFVVDMNTITNEDLKEKPDYQKKLVSHLSSEDFFNVTKYPIASFKLISATYKSKDEASIKGELTMLDKKEIIEFPAKVTVDKGIVSGEATLKIDRTKWGLKYGSGNFFKELTADKIISDEFDLTLKLEAKKQ